MSSQDDTNIQMAKKIIFDYLKEKEYFPIVINSDSPNSYIKYAYGNIFFNETHEKVGNNEVIWTLNYWGSSPSYMEKTGSEIYQRVKDVFLPKIFLLELVVGHDVY